LSDAAPAGDDIREWLAQASAFHRATMLGEAAALYEKVLAAVPGEPAALYPLGVLRQTQGDFDAAIRLLAQATAARPSNPSFHAAFGAALRGAGRIDEALAEYDQAILLKPDFAEAHNHRAIALQRLERFDAAIDGYRAAIAARSDYAEAYNNLGTALRRAGRSAEALDAYRAALSHRPGYIDALGNLGKLEAELGQKLAAVETYRRLLELRPDDFDALAAMGDLLVLVDEDEAALGYYAQAIELRPRDPVLLDRTSIALLILDRYEEATGLLGTAVGIDDKLASAWLHYGIALEKLGQVDAARRALETAVELDPALPLAHFTLGTLLLAIDQLEAARPIFADWYRRSPDHPTARHMMAAVCGAEAPARASAAYIVETFDHFAKTFDGQLARLEYRGPQLVGDLLGDQPVPPDGSLSVADLGCGTGLCAEVLRPWAARLVGVDLAPGMLERARRRQLYDELVEADIVDFLVSRPDGFDLLVAADTLIYFGDLAPVMAAAAAALRPGGRFVFTVEEAIGFDASPAPVLTTTGRYQHTASYIRDRSVGAGFNLLELRRCVIRNEGRQAVGGLVVLIGRVPPSVGGEAA
jgi:predicted TPR repeat methyltransferase